jgi:hypothetical protein
MPIGPGKYGAEAIEVFDKLQAKGVILVVLDGPKGNGIAIHGPALLHGGVPDFLEALAKDIRKAAQADAAAIHAGAAVMTDRKQ